MAIQPLADKLVVKRLEEEEITRGGIILPDTAKEKPQQGKVIAVGPGLRLEEGGLKKLEVKKGDKVLYGKYSGTEVKLSDEAYLILREEDVLAVIE